MKSLVIYDSNFGNTRSIASAIANELKSEAISVNNITSDSLNGVELLVVGSPINAWRPTVKISEFLDSLSAGKLKNVKAAAFDTRIKLFLSGNAAKRISNKLEAKGATIIVHPKAFYVKAKEGPLFEGELETAKNWAKRMLQR